MSASNSSGIQTLLEAEKEAQKTVQEARAFRSQRIKASKADATKEIDSYKQKKEEEFKDASSKFNNDESQAEAAAENEAMDHIKKLKADAEKGKSQIVEYLVKEVTEI